MYNDAKLEKAVDLWITQNCTLQFGETYSGALLDDFEAWCVESGALKRSPGRVAFGRQLARHGLEKRQSLGLMMWAGIVLNNPPEHDAVAQRRQERSRAATQRRLAEREASQAAQEAEIAKATGKDASERERRLAAFKAETEAESAESVRAAAREGKSG